MHLDPAFPCSVATHALCSMRMLTVLPDLACLWCAHAGPSKPLNGGAGPAGKCPFVHSAPAAPKDKNA